MTHDEDEQQGALPLDFDNYKEESAKQQNEIPLSTMFDSENAGFISTDKLDEVFSNTEDEGRKPRREPIKSGIGPVRSSISLEGNSSVGEPTPRPTDLEPVPEPRFPRQSDVETIKLDNMIPRNKRPAKSDDTTQEKPIERPDKQVASGLNVSNHNQAVRIAGTISTENASVGQILQEARVSLELSLGQVEQQTRIKRSFLEAVERDDMKALPAMCYVSAYIKTLCNVYRMDQDTTQALLNSIKEKKGERTVPEELLHTLESEKHINEQEEEKFRRILVICMFVVAIVVAVCATVYLWPSESPSYEDVNPTPEKPVDPALNFTEQHLRKHIPTHVNDIDVTPLKIEKK